jgi:hypothetical protein
VKIIIEFEVPEKKIEITESEFDKAWEFASALTWTNDRKNQLKQKIFGDE